MNIKKIIGAILVFASFSSSAKVAVIVNSANNDQVTNKLIKRIYLGKTKAFPNGKRVKVYALNDSVAETQIFRKNALNKSNSQFKSYWAKLAFTGKGTPPKQVNSAAEMINAVKGSVSAIGFIDSSAATSDVKVIATF